MLFDVDNCLMPEEECRNVLNLAAIPLLQPTVEFFRNACNEATASLSILPHDSHCAAQQHTGTFVCDTRCKVSFGGIRWLPASLWLHMMRLHIRC